MADANTAAENTAVSTQLGDIDLKELLEAGVHFGHQTQRWNPRMRDYIYAERDGVHIFDLVKTAEQLQKAMDFARRLGKEGKTLVFVGTKRQAQEIIREKATEAGAMYIVTRWLGGFLTNHEQVGKSIKRMNRIYKGLEDGTYDSYTKFEQGQLRKEADRSARFLEGVKDLKGLPDAIFIADLTEDKVASREAKIMNMPVIAIADSNADPDMADYVIPGNDDAVSSISILTEMVAQAYAEGKKARSK
jgi:small subunit ribosomal protein S2